MSPACFAASRDFVAWIVVVDDCSPDDTAAIVEEQARRDPRIRLLRHEENQGVGGAVLTGYAEAHRLGAEIIVKMDSDGQMDPAYLPALIAPIVPRRGRLHERQPLPPRPAASLDAACCVASETWACRS